MDKYVEIIKLLERIFGKSAVSKSLGTRTNVVRFPKGKQGLDPTTRHFDVEGTAKNNPDLVNTIKNSIEDRMGDITKMNDQELLTYKQNLQRLADYTSPPPPPMADVIEAGSKQRVTGEGLEKLIEEQGLVSSPKTPLGSAQLNIKRAGQEMNKIIKENDLDSLLKGAGRDQLSWNRLHNEGLVRAVTRQILSEDIRAGKIKGLTLDDLGTSREPIDYFRKIYGEGALEQLDSLTPEFNRLSTEQEAAKLARSKFKFEPDETRTKGSTSYEELEKEIKKPEPEEKADGGSIGLDYLMGMDSRPKYASGGDVKKILDLIAKANKELKGKKSMETVNPKTGEVTVPTEPVKTAEKQTKEFTDDEMISYIKKYKEERPTLEEFTAKVNKETGSSFTPEQLAHAYRIKVAYPHSTPIVDSEGKFIGGGLYNPPLDVSISDRDTLTKSIVQTRKAKGLSVPKKYQEELKSAEVVETPETPPKAGEGRFTKQQVLEKIIQSTIQANPTDEYVQKTFPNFLKEIREKPELANNENVWRTFTQDFPENKRLVVYGDDTVDFFTKGENLPEGMKQTEDLINTYGISMEEARRIKQMEPEDQVMEIKKLQVLKGKKYKQGDPITEENFGNTPFAPSQETLDNLKKAREMTKGMSLEEEMNMVLNQYDKSMFVKNEQGIVDVTNPENVQKMALLLKRDHPELYRRLEMQTEPNILENFDITGRKPNKDGGLNHLLGF